MLRVKIEEREETGYFPFFVDIKNKHIFIYGGGQIAFRRIQTLLKFQAKITVIAPDFLDEIHTCQGVVLEKRPFVKGEILALELGNIPDIVLAATDDKEANECIYMECKEKGIFTNNASNQKQCDFFFPAIVETGDFVMGISSSGKNTKGVKKIAAKIRSLAKEWENERNKNRNENE